MDFLLQLLNNLIDPDWIMAHGGLFLVAFIIFAETGLFIGFFLPGDSLLFVTGMIIAGAKTHLFPFDGHVSNLIFWILFLSIMAVLGNFTGYWFGKKSGPMLYKRKDGLLFKRKHLEAAHEFYEKRGGMAIALARFLPIVRTFAPIIGGIVKMHYPKFIFYNLLGAFLWISSITSLGFILGENQWIKDHLEYVILGLILITTGPVLYKMIFGKKKSSEEKPLLEEPLEKVG